jgi:class 3 adenylate cyclase
VLRQRGDYFGPVVNLASRINRLADPGSLVVDTAARADLGAAALEADPLGERELKGIGAVELFRVRRI